MAKYDFETAIAMLETKRYLYVGFMLHQTIEKVFKAYYVYLKDEIPLRLLIVFLNYQKMAASTKAFLRN